jgi:hypothetical protein
MLRKALIIVGAFFLTLSVTPGPSTGSVTAADPVLSPIPCADGPFTPADPAFEALPGATAYYGEYDGGAYQFEVPDDWNGELILYMHGTSVGPTLRVRTPDALREFAVDNGFAIGASSYRCNDYRPGIGLTDTVLLKGLFNAATGENEPSRTYLTGTSMGGFQTQLAMDVFPTMFDGALAMCGMNSANWDFYVAIGAAAEYITGIQFDDPDNTTATQEAMIDLLGLPGSLTDKGLQLASVMINLSGGPRPFAMEGLVPPFRGVPAYQFIISGATLAGRDLPGDVTRGNADAVYFVDPGLGLTSAALDAGVRRVAPDETVYEQYVETRPLTGEIERPLMTLFNTADYVVSFSSAQALQRAVDSADRSDLLVQRIIRAPGHCGYSDTEIKTAMTDLVDWVREGVRPDGDNVLGDLRNAGLKFTNPLRPGDPGTIRVPIDPHTAREDCKDAWRDFFFPNQGLCNRFVNTGH